MITLGRILKWCTIIALREGVGLKREQFTITMSTCASTSALDFPSCVCGSLPQSQQSPTASTCPLSAVLYALWVVCASQLAPRLYITYNKAACTACASATQAEDSSKKTKQRNVALVTAGAASSACCKHWRIQDSCLEGCNPCRISYLLNPCRIPCRNLYM